MKILLLGAGGMAGHVVATQLVKLGCDITGLARRELPFVNTIVADVCDIEKITLDDYDAVVNCIGVLVKYSDENPAKAIWINSYLPHLLAKITRNSKTKIIHLSTDCVFDGHNKGGYTEKSIPNADYRYGRTKALGELNDNKNLTFRMSIIGPDINETGVGLFNWFMKQKTSVGGYTRAIWTGVTTLTLANAIYEALNQNLTGLYHLVNNQIISKYKLLNLFNNLRNNPIEIIENNEFCENKSLINTRTDFDFSVPSYVEMVKEMGVWIKSNKNLYKNYGEML